MADLLTHVLVAYVLATLLSWRYRWLAPAYVTVAMLGAIQPDVSRADLVVPAVTVEAALAVPFDWWALHTLGGSVVVAAAVGLLVPSEYRRRVISLFLLGALSHHALDALLITPSGRSYAMFWPLTHYHPPTPGLYLSSDRWPAAVAVAVAAAVYAIDRRRASDGRSGAA